MIRFENITKLHPNGTVALDDVSLAVARGEFTVILGPSGAGKTTLLKVVNGLVQPTRGELFLDGARICRRNLRQARRKVSMIYQQFGLVPRLSVEDNVVLGALAELPFWRAMLRCYPLQLRRRAAALVHQVGLGEAHFARRASELSGGEQQRVGIARAFLMHPSVVLADEPVASLDPRTSVDVLRVLRETARNNGASVLCSLHQLELARSVGDRVVGMRAGRIVFDGPPQALDAAAVALIYGGAPTTCAEERV